MMNQEQNINNANTSLGELREFSIWMEGYAETGGSGIAQWVGTGIGRNFNEAVKDLMTKHPEHGIDEYDDGTFGIWGCRLYADETDARKSFG